MKVEQISVFIENKAGKLAELTRLIGDAGVNIRALSLADTSDFGILRLIVSDVKKAMATLKEAGYTVSMTDVVVIEVPDRPGGLADVLDSLQQAGINVEYMYAFVEKATDHALVVFRFEDVESAVRVIEKAGVSVLPADKVYSI
jgi:hypothetical protein